MLSFATLVRRSQFGTTKKQTILHETVKYSVSDVSASFRTHLCINPTLYFSGQISSILQRQLRGCKTLDPTNKYQTYIPSKLVLHIYKQKNAHIDTAIGQMVACAFYLAWNPVSILLFLNGRTNAHAPFVKGACAFVLPLRNSRILTGFHAR